MNAASDVREAARIVAEIEAAGGRVQRRPGGVHVEPCTLLTPELSGRIRAVAGPFLAILETCDRRAVAAPSEAPGAPRCELHRFPEWSSSIAVRFCSVYQHWHDDDLPTFDAVELDILGTWARRCGARHLSRSMRSSLLSLKVELGGRLDPETIEQLDARR